MTTAATLAIAAGQAFDNLQVRYVIGSLKLVLQNFWSATIDLFPQSDANSHPVSNWIVIIAAQAASISTGVGPLQDLTAAATAVYKLCWMASFLQGTGGITNTQALALLGAYNSIIAVP